MSDTLQRFLLRGAAVRGEFVSLDASWREIVGRHPGQGLACDRLGELTAAGLLLAATLKFDGKLVLQIHGDGPVSLMVVECDASGTFRATVKCREHAAMPASEDLRALVDVQGKGRFALTLDPRRRTVGLQPYQGIVPLEGTTVAQVLERYMARSEQVPTRLWLAADADRACGLLLQKLPAEGGTISPDSQSDVDGWSRMQHLADTLTRAELLAQPADTILERLFWNEPLHAFERRPCAFACSCSRDKVVAMLKMLGRAEVESIIAEQGSVSVRCDFCNAPYRFDPVDSLGLFADFPPLPQGGARH